MRWCAFERPNKTRPVLLLTRDASIPYLDEVTVAEISSRVRGIASEVPLSEVDWMPKECAVNLDHVRTVRKERLGKRIASLSPEKMRAVRIALLFALGFDDR
ncbi:MAG TPA: type II toxin-antitoxin system PemK/MazF family toxin [Tepidisphaeraceae bacterium]|nr:type II toxin-antitoxin system PemK/MazF family toxin [Tepidisphaeraceae bacterium]